MSTYDLMFLRVKLRNVPVDKKLRLAKDNRTIYYETNQLKTVVYELTNPPPNLPFITAELVTCTSNWYKIMIKIDGNKFDTIVREPCLLEDRKKFFTLMDKCHMESVGSYISHTSLNLFDDILTATTDSSSTYDWMKEREDNPISCCLLPTNIMKLGDTFIDLNRYAFLSDAPIQHIECQGGVIIDPRNYFWIEGIVKLAHQTQLKSIPRCLESNATLIIVNSAEIQIWRDTIKSINQSANIIELISTKQHTSLTYGQAIKADYLLVNLEYLLGRHYSKSWKDYIAKDNMTLNEVLDVMRSELVSSSRFNDTKNPALQIIKWHRLIIDDAGLKKRLSSNKANEILGSFDGYYRWQHLEEFPTLTDEVKMIMSYILKSNDLTFPLYDVNLRPMFLSRLMSTVNTQRTKPKVKLQKIDVTMSDFEESIHDIYENYADTLNVIAANTKTREEIVELWGIDVSFETYFSQHKHCSVCLHNIKLSNLAVTECKHMYCASCIYRSILHSDSCPLCRTGISLNNVYRIVNKKETMGSKLKMLRSLAKRQTRTIVYVKSKNTAKYLSPYVTNSVVYGGSRKRSILTQFNSQNSNVIFIPFSCYQVSKGLQKVERIIFFDVDSSIKAMSDGAYGRSYLECSLTELDVKYLVYEGEYDTEANLGSPISY